jgi:putative chitinase
MGLRYLQELWQPTDAQRRYDPPNKLAKNLGNTRVGDGYRYRGQSVTHTTGGYNYRRTTQWLRQLFGPNVPDFYAAPELLSQNKFWAIAAGVAYWRFNNLNRFADALDFRGCTKSLNGGYNGYADRSTRLTRAYMALEY